jgi:hypothetical protein
MSATPSKIPAAADALFRAAIEACRQHRRYASLVDAGVDDAELDTVLPVVALCDRVLLDACTDYERQCQKVGKHADDAWWHRANMLWHAAREHIRHQYVSSELSRPRSKHNAEALSDMIFEHALEASAMFAMRRAVDDYRAARPEADLQSRPSPIRGTKSGQGAA